MYISTIPSALMLNEPNNIYYRNKPINNRYIPGHSHNTYRIMINTLGKENDGCWIFLFGNTGTVKYHQKLGDHHDGFGDKKSLLQIALRYECLSIVLVSHSKDNYVANRTDLIYNLTLITAAVGISICLLDHIVIQYGGGYYSYRDNGLLTYIEN
jgi:DNA repair protein RadC